MVVGSLAVFFAGITVFMGKMSWPLGMTICIGMILISSSNQIAGLFLSGVLPGLPAITGCGLLDGAFQAVGCFAI